MRYVPNDKYTIAWFKLAECVAKGEKEKAFGVYRLLKHSLEDQAYAYQLEGDLLSAFGDEKAAEKYAHAARLYYHNNQHKEAVALYEELILLTPHEVPLYLQCIVGLIQQHPDLHERIEVALKKMMSFLIDGNHEAFLPSVFAALEPVSEHWYGKAKEYVAGVY